MHLRSGSRVGIAKAPSLAPTQGSGTQARKVSEEQEIDLVDSSTSSESDSMSESGDIYDPMGQHDQAQDVGTSNIDTTPSYQLEFNIKLRYDYTNDWGAEIYHDPMQRQVYKTAECPTPFEQSPWVNYQGDMYVGEDGARYEVTEHPHLVNAAGSLQPKIKEPEDVSLQRGMGKEPEHPTTSRGSKGTGMSTNPFELEEDNVGKSPVEEQEVTTGFTFEMGDWTTVKEFPV